MQVTPECEVKESEKAPRVPKYCLMRLNIATHLPGVMWNIKQYQVCGAKMQRRRIPRKRWALGHFRFSLQCGSSGKNQITTWLLSCRIDKTHTFPETCQRYPMRWVFETGRIEQEHQLTLRVVASHCSKMSGTRLTHSATIVRRNQESFTISRSHPNNQVTKISHQTRRINAMKFYLGDKTFKHLWL